MAVTASLPASSATSHTTTRAPSDAKSSAAARPMPPPAPVMSATLPVSRSATSGHLLVVVPGAFHDLRLQRRGEAAPDAARLFADEVVHLVGHRLNSAYGRDDEPRPFLGFEIRRVGRPR